MSKSVNFILNYLKGKDWTSPTEIGRAYGEYIESKALSYHSSWASPKCRKMVEDKLLERNEKGHYRLIEVRW